MNKVTKAIEDYLEMILILSSEDQSVHATKIAERLNVSRAAVTKEMKELLDLKYVKRLKDGSLLLTSKGKKIALKVYDRHLTIKDFLISLGVDNAVAEIDCCKIEHVISEETLNKIKEYLERNGI